MTSSDIISPEMITALGLGDVRRARGLAHAATERDAAAKKSITRSDKPLSQLDFLMREE